MSTSRVLACNDVDEKHIEAMAAGLEAALVDNEKNHPGTTVKIAVCNCYELIGLEDSGVAAFLSCINPTPPDAITGELAWLLAAKYFTEGTPDKKHVRYAVLSLYAQSILGHFLGLYAGRFEPLLRRRRRKAGRAAAATSRALVR